MNQRERCTTRVSKRRTANGITVGSFASTCDQIHDRCSRSIQKFRCRVTVELHRLDRNITGFRKLRRGRGDDWNVGLEHKLQRGIFRGDACIRAELSESCDHDRRVSRTRLACEHT